MALMLAMTVCLGRLREGQGGWDIGDWSQVDAAQAEQAFANTQGNAELVTLVHALAWRAKTLDEDDSAAKLYTYGQLLLDRARAGVIDLENAGDPDCMLRVLEAVRDTGAK